MLDNLNAIAESLKRSPDILKSFIDSIPEEELRFKREDGYWTLEEHVGHLAEVQSMIYGRLVRFKEEINPVFTPYNPEDKEKKQMAFIPAGKSLETFRDWREKQLEFIESFTEKDLSNQGSHPEYKIYNPLILIRHTLMHDHWHMYRMEEIWLSKAL